MRTLSKPIPGLAIMFVIFVIPAVLITVAMLLYRRRRRS